MLRFPHVRALCPLLCFLASPIAAQSYFYIPDNRPSAGPCNVIPWGTQASSTTWANQRYQVLVRKADLGNNLAPKRICSLAFTPCNGYQHTSATLQITMAQTKSATLSTTFANNLSINPVVVYKGAMHTWPMVQDAWNNVGLQRPYLMIPPRGENLVIEVIVTRNDNTGARGRAGFHRASTNDRLFAFGWTGSPPTTGRTPSRAALKMRLGVL